MMNLTNKKGVILLLAAFAILFMSILIIGYLEVAATETEIMRNHKMSTKALYIAEGGVQAGIRYIIDNLLSDSDWSDNNAVIYTNVSLGDGDYDVELKNGTTTTIVVESNGNVSGFTRIMKQTVTGVSKSFYYAQHSNKDIDFKDSTGTVTGNISAGAEVKNEGGMTINGTILENSSVVAPNVSYSSYESIANYTYSNDFTFTSGTYTGIYYFEKNVVIMSNVTINGTIISKEEVKLEGNNITISPFSNYPAVVAKEKIEIESISNINITGLVYAEEEIEIEKSSNITINGSTVSKEKMEIKESSSVTITYNSAIRAKPPPYFSGANFGGVSVSAWQES